MPGAIGLTPGLLFLLQANSLNGGTYQNVDPGFAALARLRPNVRKYFQSIGEVRPLVSQDNVIVAISSNMLQVEIAQGSPVGDGVPRRGVPRLTGGRAGGARHARERAGRAIHRSSISDPQVQLAWAREYNVSVFNSKAAVPHDVLARIANKVVFFDANEVSRRREAWVDRWMREVRG